LAVSAVLCTQCGFNRKTSKMVAGAARVGGKGRTGRLVVMGVGMAAVLLFAGGAWFFLNRPSRAEDPKPERMAAVNGVPNPGTRAESKAKPAQTTARGTSSAPKSAIVKISGPAEGTTALALSRDGKWLVSGGADHTVRLWSLPELTAVKALEGHNDPVRDVAITPDSGHAASVGGESNVIIWDLSTGAALQKYQHSGPVARVRFISDREVAIAAGAEILFWQIGADKPTRTLDTGSEVSVMDISPDNSKILVGQSKVGMLRVWDIASGKQVAEYRHRSSQGDPLAMSDDLRASYLKIDGAMFLDDHRVLAGSGHLGGYIWQWESATAPVELEKLTYNKFFWSGTDSLVIISDEYGMVRAIDTAFAPIGKSPDKNGRRVEMRASDQWCAALTVSSQWVAVAGGGRWQADGSWKSDRRPSIAVIPVATLRKAVADVHETASKLEKEQNERIAQAREAIKNKTATPSQKNMMQMTLMNEALTPVDEIELPKGLFSMALSPDGKVLAAACGDYSVRVYDFATHKEMKKLQGHRGPVTDVCFSADSKYLLSGSWDGSVVLWDWQAGSIEHTVKSPSPVMRCAMLPDGKHAVVDGILRIQFWDLEKEKLVGEGMASEDARALAVSPKGLVATGGIRGEAIVWDPTTGKPIARRTLGTILYNLYFAGEDTLLVSYPQDPGAVWHWKQDEIQILDYERKEGALGDDGKVIPMAEIHRAMNRTSVWCVRGYLTKLFDPTGKFDIRVDGSLLKENGPVLSEPGKIIFFDAEKIKDFQENFHMNIGELRR
jgi:WD40 repeat protein